MFKYLNIIIFLIASCFINNEDDISLIKFDNQITCEKEGGKVFINGNEIIIEFSRGVKILPKDAIWEIEKSDSKIILKHTNEEGVTFIQNWDISDKYNINLTVNCLHKNQQLEINFEIIIKRQNETYIKKSKDKIIYNFEDKFNSVYSKDIKEAKLFENKAGWAGFKNEKNIFVIVSGNNCYINNSVIKISNIQSNKDISSFQLNIHNSPLTSSLLTNKDKFNQLEKALEFGWLRRISTIVFKFFNFFMKHTNNNIILSLLLIILMLTLLIWPLVFESIKIHERIFQASPEIKVIETLYSNNFAQFNKEREKIFSRYQINQFIQVFGQMIIFFTLTIFSDFYINFNCYSFVPVITNERLFHIIALSILSLTIVFYNYFILKSNHLIFIAASNLLYWYYNSFVLIALSFVYLMIIISTYISKMKAYVNN